MSREIKLIPARLIRCDTRIYKDEEVIEFRRYCIFRNWEEMVEYESSYWSRRDKDKAFCDDFENGV